MYHVILDKYFDSLDFVNEVNKEEFENLDLSDFFTNADTEMKLKIKERLTTQNNFNRIYILVAFDAVRTDFGLIMNEPQKENE